MEKIPIELEIKLNSLRNDLLYLRKKLEEDNRTTTEVVQKIIDRINYLRKGDHPND